jgi:hypothetical protein
MHIDIIAMQFSKGEFSTREYAGDYPIKDLITEVDCVGYFLFICI